MRAISSPSVRTAVVALSLTSLWTGGAYLLVIVVGVGAFSHLATAAAVVVFAASFVALVWMLPGCPWDVMIGAGVVVAAVGTAAFVVAVIVAEQQILAVRGVEVTAEVTEKVEEGRHRFSTNRYRANEVSSAPTRYTCTLRERPGGGEVRPEIPSDLCAGLEVGEVETLMVDPEGQAASVRADGFRGIDRQGPMIAALLAGVGLILVVLLGVGEARSGRTGQAAIP